MKRILMAALAAGSVIAGASGASAAETFDLIELTGPGSDFFGADIVDILEEDGEFTHVFNFTLTDPGQANSTVTTIELQGNVINLDSIFLDGFAFTKILDTGFSEFWQRSAVTLSAGPHSVTVKGSVDGETRDGSYSGVINIAAAIPEPGTWALMIGGFGAAGAMLRRRRALALA